jgi:pimeloyl-ACP methyl ester carboxylesterase
MATVTGTTSRDVQLPSGLICRVIEAGPGGDVPTVVYLHGAGGVSEQDEILATLARRWNVVAPMAPGFRDLSELSEIDDVHDLAIHYDEVFEALGLDGACVVGHSFGGMVAAELAAHYPSRVARLVLLGPVGLWDDDEPVADVFGVGVTELGGLMWGDPEGPGARAMREGLETIDVSDPKVVDELLIPMMQGFSAAAKFMWPIPEKGLAKRLRRIAAPTLLVWGANDRLVPVGYADRFERAIPDARVRIVPGAGHMLPVEAGDEVIAAMEGFLG